MLALFFKHHPNNSLSEPSTTFTENAKHTSNKGVLLNTTIKCESFEAKLNQ